jgi:hypothetical protein
MDFIYFALPENNDSSGIFVFDYDVEINPDFQNQVDETLILMATYCANYIMAMMYAGAAS